MLIREDRYKEIVRESISTLALLLKRYRTVSLINDNRRGELLGDRELEQDLFGIFMSVKSCR